MLNITVSFVSVYLFVLFKKIMKTFKSLAFGSIVFTVSSTVSSLAKPRIHWQKRKENQHSC